MDTKKRLIVIPFLNLLISTLLLYLFIIDINIYQKVFIWTCVVLYTLITSFIIYNEKSLYIDIDFYYSRIITIVYGTILGVVMISLGMLNIYLPNIMEIHLQSVFISFIFTGVIYIIHHILVIKN